MTSTIIDYSWKVRFSQNGDWTDVNHCTSSAFCTTKTSVLPDGTKVRVSANGTLITLVHRAGVNAGDRAQFLFEVWQENGARRHIFTVNFTAICECC